MQEAMSQSSLTASVPRLIFSLTSSGFVVAVGGAASALLCDGTASASAWPGIGWSVVGPWLGTALSLLPGRDAPPSLASLPPLALFGSLCGLLLLPGLHPWLLALTLFAFAIVLGASVYRAYTLRLASSLACGAGLAALHAFAVLSVLLPVLSFTLFP
jgi:hypothetical protein